MSDIRLSQDAEYLLCELYTAYRIRRKNGMTSDKAKLFGGSKAIQTEFIQQWPTNDIDEAARELHRCGMLLCGYGDNSIRNCVLLSNGIVYMEHHFGDKLDQLIQRIAALRAAIFG
jgi:hypothetical protein